MLVGAPLFSAQLGAHTIRKLLSSGDDATSLNLATVGTAGQFIKTLGKMSPLNVLRLINKTNEEALTVGLLQHADDLDYIQNLLSVIGSEPGVNPVMNAVSDAFSRRRFSGRFKIGDQSVKLDALLNSRSKVPTDDDEAAGHKTQRAAQRQSDTTSPKPCFLFQTTVGLNRADTATFVSCVNRLPTALTTARFGILAPHPANLLTRGREGTEQMHSEHRWTK